MRTAFWRSVLCCATGTIALLASAPAVAQPANSQRSPFLGTWELDLSRMPDSYGPPPERVLFNFQDVGGGQWRTTVDITAQDGSVRHIAVRYARDGSAAPSEQDNSEADSAAIILPAPNILVMNPSKNKVLGSVRVYVISADGREMTESAAGMSPAGAPFVRNFHFRRLR